MATSNIANQVQTTLAKLKQIQTWIEQIQARLQDEEPGLMVNFNLTITQPAMTWADAQLLENIIATATNAGPFQKATVKVVPKIMTAAVSIHFTDDD